MFRGPIIYHVTRAMYSISGDEEQHSSKKKRAKDLKSKKHRKRDHSEEREGRPKHKRHKHKSSRDSKASHKRKKRHQSESD